LFDYILRRCQEAGLVGGQTVLIDSTVVQANASMDSVTTLRYCPGEYWEQLEKAAGPSPAVQEETVPNDEPPSPSIGHKRAGQDESPDVVNRGRHEPHEASQGGARQTGSGQPAGASIGEFPA